jgi:hypothetical protein
MKRKTRNEVRDPSDLSDGCEQAKAKSRKLVVHIPAMR